MSDDQVLFVVIDKPKMRRLAARRSYTRIDDIGIVQFAEGFVSRFPPDQLLFNGTYLELSKAFKAICGELGLPHGAPQGLTLGSLRPGGATWLYRVTDNSELVRFRGRWASSRMLEIYIQEVGTASIVPGLSKAVRERLLQLAAYVPQELARVLAELLDGSRA